MQLPQFFFQTLLFPGCLANTIQWTGWNNQGNVTFHPMNEFPRSSMRLLLFETRTTPNIGRRDIQAGMISDTVAGDTLRGYNPNMDLGQAQFYALRLSYACSLHVDTSWSFSSIRIPAFTKASFCPFSYFTILTLKWYGFVFGNFSGTCLWAVMFTNLEHGGIRHDKTHYTAERLFHLQSVLPVSIFSQNLERFSPGIQGCCEPSVTGILGLDPVDA